MMDTSKKLTGYFSKNLEYLRRLRSLSLAEMGVIIGMGKSIVANYEKGLTEPSAATVFKIVQYFGIDFGDFMTKDLSKPVHKESVQGNVQGNVQGIIDEPAEKYTKRLYMEETLHKRCLLLTELVRELEAENEQLRQEIRDLRKELREKVPTKPVKG